MKLQLDIEIEQTQEIMQKKSDNAEWLENIESDLKAITREFYCEICDKQYKNVAEVHIIYYKRQISRLVLTRFVKVNTNPWLSYH
jgi:hypothetical protein